MKPDLIPALDAAGLPGPPWLFHALLVFTFVLHMLFMNLTLGGTVMAWIAHLRSSKSANDPNTILANRIMSLNSFAISLTITTGIAPLLFVQILYQQYFYSATILMGWIWFGFLIALTLGYYATYLYKFSAAKRNGVGNGLWLAVAAIMFLVIAMTHVAVHLIHIQPAQWPQFADNPLRVLGDPTYWPRLLHFVFASIGFSGMVIAWWATRRVSQGRDVEANTAIARMGWKWALWMVGLVVADGFLLLLVLPTDVLLGIMRGGIATLGPLTLSILLGIGLLVMLARASDPLAKPKLVTGTLAGTLLTIGVMSITRHQVRVLYMEPQTSTTAVTVVPQWFNFALFVILLVVAVATVAYMARRVLSEPASGSEAA